MYLLELSHSHIKRRHLFLLIKSTLCNPPKVRCSLKKRDPWCINRVSPWKAGSVIYFPIIYDFFPFPSSLKSEHCWSFRLWFQMFNEYCSGTTVDPFETSNNRFNWVQTFLTKRGSQFGINQSGNPKQRGIFQELKSKPKRNCFHCSYWQIKPLPSPK